MALHFGYDKCKDVQDACTSPFDSNEWHPVGNTIVWATMALGMSRITEENKAEFWARLDVYQRAVGGLMNSGEGKTLWLTKADVERYVGLWTNASTKNSAAFWKVIKRLYADRYEGKTKEKSAFEQCAATC
jgi:hypothetical protein